MNKTLIDKINSMNDDPIQVNKMYIDLGTGICGAIMLSHLLKLTNENTTWIQKTIEDFKKETGLTRLEQEKARRKLNRLDFIEEYTESFPKKIEYRVIQENLYKALMELNK